LSRAFVKEGDDDGRVEQLPDRPQSPHTNYVTPDGLKSLQLRVAELTARRVDLIQQESLQSRQDLSVVERDLRYYEERLQRAVPVGLRGSADGRVRFGDTVTIRDRAGRERRYSIVGEDEADAQKGRISWVSPLAAALLQAESGDIVTWHRPSGDEELEILGIDGVDGE
jgi:transcription elongation GreA/GreB family factor